MAKRTSRKHQSKKSHRTSRPASRRRTSKRLLANVIPPPPSSGWDDWADWLQTTYEIGTHVRLGPWLPPGVRGAGDAGVPRGTLGRVVDIKPGHSARFTVWVEFQIPGQPLFTSTGASRVEVVPITIESLEDPTPWLIPLDDNWASLAAPKKRTSKPQGRGWGRQLSASRGLRARAVRSNRIPDAMFTRWDQANDELRQAERSGDQRRIAAAKKFVREVDVEMRFANMSPNRKRTSRR